ncbi:Uncharacterised protein [Legionella pneumophila]|nr:Uncharacterised protein [Legionella pneumophila]
MHFPQLEFLPSKDFESIGEKEGEHLECFIFANLQEILSHNNSDSSERNSTSEPSDNESEIHLNTGNVDTIIIANEPNPTEAKPQKKDQDGQNKIIQPRPVVLKEKSTPELDEHPKKQITDDVPKPKTKRSVLSLMKKPKPKEKENASPAVDETPPAKKKCLQDR